jgi:hypothetical protein
VHWKTLIQELLQFDEIFLSGGTHDQEPIYQRPYSQATTGKQFANTQSGITDEKTIDTQSSSQYGYDNAGGRILELQGLDDRPLGIIQGKQTLSDLHQLIALEKFPIAENEHVYFVVVHF